MRRAGLSRLYPVRYQDAHSSPVSTLLLATGCPLCPHPWRPLSPDRRESPCPRRRPYSPSRFRRYTVILVVLQARPAGDPRLYRRVRIDSRPTRRLGDSRPLARLQVLRAQPPDLIPFHHPRRRGSPLGRRRPAPGSTGPITAPASQQRASARSWGRSWPRWRPCPTRLPKSSPRR